MQKLRIVLVSAFFHPHVGGVENYTQNVARELAGLGHEVVVLTSRLAGQADHCEASPEGYLILRLDSGFLLEERFPFPVPTRANRTIYDWIVDFAPQAVVIGARFYPICVLGAHLARRAGVCPLVVEHVSAYLTLDRPVLDRLMHVYEHAMMRLVTCGPSRFYGVSKASVRWLRTFGIRARGVLHNAIDAQRFTDAGASSSRCFRAEMGVQGPDRMLVIYTGRFTPEKGVREVLAAAQVLADLNPRIHFAFAGEGPLEPQMAQAAAHGSNVSFLGRLNQADLAALTAQADVLCLPSRSEGLPTALLEAAACGTAVVVTPVGGTDELMPDAGCGIVLADRSVAEVCAALLFLVDHPAVRRCMGQNLRARAGAYTWRATTQDLLAAAGQTTGLAADGMGDAGGADGSAEGGRP